MLEAIKAMEKINNITTEVPMVLLPKSALDEIQAGLQEVKTLILSKAREEVQSEWLESEDARKLLAVSPKTWQTYRDSRTIPFSQFGRKIYVKRADIEAFLQAHSINANTAAV